MSAVVLVLGWAVVWAAGAAIAALLLRKDASDEGSAAFVLGSGWFIGAFLLTVWMRGLSMLHVPFGIVSIGAPFAIVVVAIAWFARKTWPTYASGVATTIRGGGARSWRRNAWLLLCLWIAVRFALLLVDVVLRPLYPWDAWTQWGTKARVWFELHTMAPFVQAADWLVASSPNVYFDAAPHYPATVPLWQVWSATLIGHWDDSIVNLPWWITAVAFGVVIYGFLVQERFSPLVALVGVWLVLSLPILDAHVALAGYADLPMATYLTVGAIFAIRAARSRDWRHAILALTLLVACALIKNPGKVWIAVLLPGLLATVFPSAARKIALVALIGAIAIMVVLAQTEPVILGYHLHLDFAMPWNALANAYFEFGNWHLLWYGCIAIGVLAWRRLLTPNIAPYTLFVGSGLLFLMFGFAFTNVRIWVEDQSTVNRATLHLAPVVIIWMLMAFREWSQASATEMTGTAPTPAQSAA